MFPHRKCFSLMIQNTSIDVCVLILCLTYSAIKSPKTLQSRSSPWERGDLAPTLIQIFSDIKEKQNYRTVMNLTNN